MEWKSEGKSSVNRKAALAAFRTEYPCEAEAAAEVLVLFKNEWAGGRQWPCGAVAAGGSIWGMFDILAELCCG